MKPVPFIKTKNIKYYLVKDYGDTCNYMVMCISLPHKEITFKSDKRIKNETDFKNLYAPDGKLEYKTLKIS